MIFVGCADGTSFGVFFGGTIGLGDIQLTPSTRARAEALRLGRRE
jgi:hypothetical protein